MTFKDRYQEELNGVRDDLKNNLGKYTVGAGAGALAADQAAKMAKALIKLKEQDYSDTTAEELRNASPDIQDKMMSQIIGEKFGALKDSAIDKIDEYI